MGEELTDVEKCRASLVEIATAKGTEIIEAFIDAKIKDTFTVKPVAVVTDMSKAPPIVNFTMVDPTWITK